MKKIRTRTAFMLYPVVLSGAIALVVTLSIFSPTNISAQTGRAATYLPGAERGVAKDLTCLAECYEYGYGVEEDLNEALRLYTQAAFRKDPQAIFRIGYFYETGKGGLQKDYAEAFKYYNVAASQGNQGAMLYLAELYEEGSGCSQNLQMAYKLYLLSCVRDYSFKGAKRCAKLLGIDTLSMPGSNIGVFSKYSVGENPDLRAIYGTYETYMHGLEGIEKDPMLALIWLEKAAEGGFTAAQAELGNYFYSKGEYTKAVKWLNAASLKGDQTSMSSLADIYSYGFPGATSTPEVIYNLYIGAGNFDKAKNVFSNLKLISDSKLLEQQINIFNYLNGASQPAPQPTPQTTLGGQTGNQNQTGTYGQTQTQSNYNEPRRVLCTHCNGSGYICVVKTVPTYGTHTNVKTRCQHCSQLLEHGIVHIQRKCPHCQGKGYILR